MEAKGASESVTAAVLHPSRQTLLWPLAWLLHWRPDCCCGVRVQPAHWSCHVIGRCLPAAAWCAPHPRPPLTHTALLTAAWCTHLVGTS